MRDFSPSYPGVVPLRRAALLLLSDRPYFPLRIATAAASTARRIR